MANNFLMSPGVLVQERDQSSYTVTSAATQVAMVGYASKGPVDTPMLVTSAQDFINKFGAPPSNNPYMGLAALKFFEEGSRLIISRAGYNTRDVRGLPGWQSSGEVTSNTGWMGKLTKATSEIDRALQTAAVPSITGTKDFQYGLTYLTDVDFTLRYYNDRTGESKTFNVSGDLLADPGRTSVALLASDLNTLIGTITGASTYFEFSQSGANYLILRMPSGENEYLDNKASISISGTGGSTTISQLGFLQDNRSAHGVGDGTGADIPASGITVTAKTEGSWGNDITLRFYSETTSQFDSSSGTFLTQTIYKAQVYYKGGLIETFDQIDWEDDSSDYWVEDLFPTALGEGSNYISIEFNTTANPSSPYTPPEDISADSDDFIQLGTDGAEATQGANGIPIVDDTYGFNAEQTDALNNTALTELDRGINTLANSETWEFDVVLVPGQSSSVVINSIFNLVMTRRDCMAIIDSPFGLTYEDVAEWHNGQGHGNSAAFNTSYAALYWPWLYDYDAYNRQYVWLPPSGYVAKQYVYTDNVSDPWQAPAGMTRGKITALDLEQSASQSQRDLLYGETNAVNPIVNFVGEGLTIWGQKTLLRDTKATNRVNVRRLLIYAERLVAKMAKSFVFEPTDETAWADFTRRANAIMEPIRIRRGLYSYKVVMDSTTNIPEVIDQNKMVGYIFLQPTKTAEFIEVYFTVTSTGDTFISE